MIAMSTVGELTPKDLGRRVRISGGQAVVEGHLNDFQVETDWITERHLGQNADDAEQIPGRRTVSVTVGLWATDRLALSTEVEFL